MCSPLLLILFENKKVTQIKNKKIIKRYQLSMIYENSPNNILKERKKGYL